MKKTFWSLAALMMLMAAPVMTSCSNDLDEAAPVEEVKENVVTLTIKMPEQAETRVGIDDGTLKLTGWDLGDIVKVYNVDYDGGVTIDGGIPFKCIDPESGTFSGSLPDGESLSNYNFAAFGHDIEVAGDYAGFFDNMISESLKKVILLAGPISGETCTMSIHNNVIKVTNNGSPVTVAWSDGNNFKKLWYQVCDLCPFIPVNSVGCGHTTNTFNVNFAEADPITIPTGTSYIFMPGTLEKVGLYTEGGDAVVPAKKHVINTGYENKVVVGKLYTITIGD